MSDGKPPIVIYTRRRLLGKSRPRRLGRDPDLRRAPQGDLRRRGADHQQPHGADGGDLGARSPEEAEPRRAAHRQRVRARTASRSWIHGWKKNGWKTADKKPVKNAELWQRLDEARARHDDRLALGARATPATRRTSAPTSWRAWAWPSSSRRANERRAGLSVDRRPRASGRSSSTASRRSTCRAAGGVSSTFSTLTTPSSTSIA